MSVKMAYRKLLLQAVDAFLEETPSALTQAQSIIEHCYRSINSEDKKATLDEIIWVANILKK